jgi:proline dehydrogenase
MNMLDRLIRFALPLVPRYLVGRVGRRYVAGDQLSDALRIVRQLQAEGAMATLDFLGEEIARREQVTLAMDEYLAAIEVIAREQLPCNISVKPTLFGLRLNEALCLESLDRVAASAAGQGLFMRLDMEDHTCTEATLRLYRTLQARHGNLGVVLQAMLRRTMKDIATLDENPLNVRLCKGIYREARAIAWQGPAVVQQNYLHCLEQLFHRGAYVGIATHDEQLICSAQSQVQQLGLSSAQYEFQMLLGVDPALRQILLQQGHRLRVYVPYGRDWFGYSLRRLKENPTIARHVLRALFH